MLRNFLPALRHRKTLIVFFFFLFSFVPVSSAIVQFKGESFAFSFIEAPAAFAVPVDSSGICGALYVADPLDACSPLEKVPGDADILRFVLIQRGNCSFVEKVKNAQEAGFRAAIVYDDRDNTNLISMIGDSKSILVHAVFVSKSAGKVLSKHSQGEEGECCISYSAEDTARTVLVISLISLITIMSILVVFFLARNRRLQRQGSSRHCPPSINSKIVNLLPCHIFSNSSPKPESCSICLEDYKNGESLKILPCQHEFHCVCVDAWLTKWGTFCPLCKHEIMAETLAGPVRETTTLLSC